MTKKIEVIIINKYETISNDFLFSSVGLSITTFGIKPNYAAYDKATLIPIYNKLNKWILEYDCKQIDKMFINS